MSLQCCTHAVATVRSRQEKKVAGVARRCLWMEPERRLFLCSAPPVGGQRPRIYLVVYTLGSIVPSNPSRTVPVYPSLSLSLALVGRTWGACVPTRPRGWGGLARTMANGSWLLGVAAPPHGLLQLSSPKGKRRKRPLLRGHSPRTVPVRPAGAATQPIRGPALLAGSLSRCSTSAPPPPTEESRATAQGQAAQERCAGRVESSRRETMREKKSTEKFE